MFSFRLSGRAQGSSKFRLVLKVTKQTRLSQTGSERMWRCERVVRKDFAAAAARRSPRCEVVICAHYLSHPPPGELTC